HADAARDGAVRAELDGRAEPRHPHVAGMREPIVIADVAEAVAAPAVTPGVLNPEAVPVVGDDGKGMSADDGGRLRVVIDRAALTDAAPAVVDGGGGVQHADLGDRGMHRDDILVVDAQVSTQRPTKRLGETGAVMLWMPVVFGPMGLRADP